MLHKYIMCEYKETCPYCGNQYIMTEAINHSLCIDFYEFMLTEKIAYFKQKIEICLELQNKLTKKE